ncbi:P-loop containing nucleoside triphosphate hydrolase protein [Pavlovales sp. CCMP2436]|nr:P-loop containing nucleoside triphosphate hydrolase protein [Pavlovales sp. CCMP2436]
MIRRRKAEVLTELPRKRRQRVALELEPKSSSALALAALATERRKVGLDAQTLEGQAMWDSHFAHRQLMTESWQTTGLAKLEPACAFIRETLEGCGEGEKLLVFAHHKTVLDGLEEALVRAKASMIRIDGSVPPAERTRLVNLFQNQRDVRVALLSVTAAGQGLTLTAASTVIFVELHWTPGVLLQV